MSARPQFASPRPQRQVRFEAPPAPHQPAPTDVPSPPPTHNFDEQPVVTREPYDYPLSHKGSIG